MYIGIEMSNSYNKPCRDCKQQIRMEEINGKWAAYDLNGTGFHRCSQQQQQQLKQESKPLTLEQIDTRLKRVERTLFNATATEGK